MMKKRTYLIAAAALLAIIALVFLAAPRPIVQNPALCRVVRVQYNPNLNPEKVALIDVAGYDEAALLTCLSRYFTSRIPSSIAGGYQLGDVTLDVIIDTGDGLQSILLGNENYCYTSSGKPKYTIRQADKLKAELLEVLGLASNAENPIV